MNTPKLKPIDYTPGEYVFDPNDEFMTYEEREAQRLHAMRAFELMFGKPEENDVEVSDE